MKIAIIGAGASGIAAARILLEYQIDFVCYEKGSQIGGNWRLDNDNGLSSAYPSLHINTNRYSMAYSDFPMPEDYPMFPHHSHIIRYFESYVRHFGISPYIRFNSEVINLSRTVEGRWQIETATDTATYDAVIVANGHHWDPRWPAPPFPGNFDGLSIHSHDYRNPDLLAHKNILIVGFGNSAVDIACEAARLHSGQVYISTRSGAYIVPNWIGSKPFDSLANPYTSRLPLFLQRLFLKTALKIARGDQKKFGIPEPSRPILQEHPTVSQDLLYLAARGLIHIKPHIKELQGRQVCFEDDSTAHIDLIIYCTGYKISFPFCKEAQLIAGENNELRLYKKIVHPDLQGLFFLGFIQPLGAIMPLAEVQARWIASVLKGKTRLPAPETMRKAIEQDRIAMQKRYIASPRHTIQVDFFPYKRLLERDL